MKRLIYFLSVLFLITGFAAQGQKYSLLSGRYEWRSGWFDSTLRIPHGPVPTLGENIFTTEPGAIFYNTTDSFLYVFNGSAFMKVRGVGDSASGGSSSGGSGGGAFYNFTSPLQNTAGTITIAGWNKPQWDSVYGWWKTNPLNGYATQSYVQSYVAGKFYLTKSQADSLYASAGKVAPNYTNGLFYNTLTNEVGAYYNQPMWNASYIQGRPVEAVQPKNFTVPAYDSLNNVIRWLRPDSLIGFSLDSNLWATHNWVQKNLPTFNWYPIEPLYAYNDSTIAIRYVNTSGQDGILSSAQYSQLLNGPNVDLSPYALQQSLNDTAKALRDSLVGKNIANSDLLADNDHFLNLNGHTITFQGDTTKGAYPYLYYGNFLQLFPNQILASADDGSNSGQLILSPGFLQVIAVNEQPDEKATTLTLTTTEFSSEAHDHATSASSSFYYNAEGNMQLISNNGFYQIYNLPEAPSDVDQVLVYKDSIGASGSHWGVLAHKDLSSFSDGNSYVTGGSYSSGTLTLNLNGRPDVTISGFSTGSNYTFSSEFTNASNNISVNSIAASKITGLATVATTGSYTDLINKPTIPTNNNQLANGAGYITTSALSGYEQTSNKATDFTTLNNTLYPTTQAVANYVTGKGYLTAETDAISLAKTITINGNTQALSSNPTFADSSIYNSDGTIASDRTVNANGKFIKINTPSQFFVNGGGTSNISLNTQSDIYNSNSLTANGTGGAAISSVSGSASSATYASFKANNGFAQIEVQNRTNSNATLNTFQRFTLANSLLQSSIYTVAGGITTDHSDFYQYSSQFIFRYVDAGNNIKPLNFTIQGLPSKTASAGDSVVVADIGGQLWKAPYGSTSGSGTTYTTTDQNLIISGSTINTNKAPLTLTDGATVSWDLSQGYNANVTIAGNRTLSLSNPQAGSYYKLTIIQDATGSRTITWPATVKWKGGTAPTLTTTGGAKDIVVLYYDSSGNYQAVYGLDFK